MDSVHNENSFSTISEQSMTADESLSTKLLIKSDARTVPRCFSLAGCQASVLRSPALIRCHRFIPLINPRHSFARAVPDRASDRSRRRCFTLGPGLNLPNPRAMPRRGPFAVYGSAQSPDAPRCCRHHPPSVTAASPSRRPLLRPRGPWDEARRLVNNRLYSRLSLGSVFLRFLSFVFYINNSVYFWLFDLQIRCFSVSIFYVGREIGVYRGWCQRKHDKDFKFSPEERMRVTRIPGKRPSK